MTRIVVTGASGFIGQHLVRRLLADGFDGASASVVAIGRQMERFPADLTARCDVRVLDLATSPIAEIGAACGEGAVVFHLAADASVAGGAVACTNNVRSTERLIEALRNRAPRRIVYVSSIGAVDRRSSDPCDSPLTEDSPPHPLTAYGQSKLDGERMVAASGLPFSVVRPTWVYGPGMRDDSHLRVLLGMVRRGALSARIRFPGRVSVIHVDDLCAALVLVASNAQAAGRTYFASDGAPVAIGDLFALMGELTGRRAGGVSVPKPLAWLARTLRSLLPLAAQNLHSDVLVADSSRLTALGFSPHISLRRGMNDLARTTSVQRGTWIVSGAASGIGRAIAEQLYARGAHVVAVDRDASGLSALASDLSQIEPLAADLATTAGCALVISRIGQGDAPIEGVVNCAGVGTRGRVGEIPSNAEHSLIELNVASVAAISSAAITRFRRQQTGGTLINVASSAAFQPLPLMAAYAASKSFVLSYSEALAAEVEGDHGIRVITVCPGGTATGFQAAAGVRTMQGERLMAAHEVGRRVLIAANRNASTTMLIGSRTILMSLLARVLPRRMLVALWTRLMGTLR